MQVRLALVVVTLSVLGAGRAWMALAPVARAQTAARVDFARDIQPLLRQHCLSCHGPKQQMNGLRLDRRSDALRGSAAGGVVIRPGNGDISALYLRLTGAGFGQQMPPTGALKPEQIALVKQWIDEGAAWPDALAGDVALPAADRGTLRLSAAVRDHDRAALAVALTAERASINGRGEDGTSPLMWASFQGDLEMVRALLDAGADPNLKNDAGASPLMWGIPNLPVVSLLLERGASPNVKTADGRTPLMRAAGIHGASAVVARLLDAGADTTVTTASLVGTSSALAEAAYAADPASLRVLIERGIDPASAGPGGLYYALLGDCEPCIDMLMKAASRPVLEMTAFFHGPPGADGRHMQRFLDRGIDVNARDTEGRTLLMIAAASDRLPRDLVQTLLAKGADVKAASNRGLTASDYAAMHGRTPVLDALLKAGAPLPKPVAPAPSPTRAASVRGAVERSLPILQKSDVTFWKKTGCVSCHNNTLTAETMAAARRRRVPVNEAVAGQQRDSIASYVDLWRERALQGIGIPGDADTVSYILLGLAAESHLPDRATDAMAEFLIDRQGPDGQWVIFAHRPPIESSTIEVTASAFRALQVYGARRGERSQRAMQRAAAWLARATPQSNEDRVFQVLGLVWSRASRDAVQAAARGLMTAQRQDGGWSQIPSLESDAYATGQALVALTMSGVVSRETPARRRGIEFLMETQLADGSWFVRTRAIPIQPFFESDFPHGRDQFISAAATNWAARALLLSMD